MSTEELVRDRCPCCGNQSVKEAHWHHDGGQHPHRECMDCGCEWRADKRAALAQPRAVGGAEPVAWMFTCGDFSEAFADSEVGYRMKASAEGHALAKRENAEWTIAPLYLAAPVAAQGWVPDILFDGHKVWMECGNVKSDDVATVLTAIVRIIRREAAPPPGCA